VSMIHPFDLGDSILVYRLQRQGMWLEPRYALTGAEPPVWAALSAPFRWWGRDVATYISRTAGGGIIQMRLRCDRAEADVVFLAPAVESNDEIAAMWRGLLVHCARQAGNQRVQRLYACVPEEASEILAQVRQVGFVRYTQEEVYRLEQPADVTLAAGPYEVRTPTAEDDWQLQKLRAAITPQLVKQAEGAGGSHEGVQPLAERSSGDWGRLVLLRGEEIAGMLLVQPGRSGHCLRLWGDFRDDAEVLTLLQKGLASLEGYSHRPVYCLLREYQGGVRPVLTRQGFEPTTTWSRLVKHTVVRAREPARRAWHALEPRPEPSVPGAIPSGAVTSDR